MVSSSFGGGKEIRATSPMKSRRREAGRINHVGAPNKG